MPPAFHGAVRPAGPPPPVRPALFFAGKRIGEEPQSFRILTGDRPTGDLQVLRDGCARARAVAAATLEEGDAMGMRY